jgi:hypothetical protein
MRSPAQPWGQHPLGGVAVRRQVGHPEWDRDAEHRTPPGATFHPGRAAMEAGEFFDEGQADARPLIRAPALALDAVGTLGDTGQLAFRDADARVADGEMRHAATGHLADRGLSAHVSRRFHRWGRHQGGARRALAGPDLGPRGTIA